MNGGPGLQLQRSSLRAARGAVRRRTAALGPRGTPGGRRPALPDASLGGAACGHRLHPIVGTAASRRLNAGYRARTGRQRAVLPGGAGRARPRRVARRPGDLRAGVAAEARAQHKALAGHWAHMVVHGVLHLHGYDHGNARQARVMEGLEVEILRGFGYQGSLSTGDIPNMSDERPGPSGSWLRRLVES